MSSSGWYPDPAGRPPAARERAQPSFGVVLGVVGVVLVVLGLFALNWAGRADFLDLRHAVDVSAGGLSVVTQVYVLFGFLPLLVLAGIVCVLAGLGPAVARVVTAVAGGLSGLALVGVVLWIESGGVGTDQSRHDALPVLVVIAALGVVAVGVGVGAYLDRSAVVARAAGGLLAVVALAVHLYVLHDVFRGSADPAAGAWLPAVGYGLLALGVLVPYRRRSPAPPGW